jgi:transposase
VICDQTIALNGLTSSMGYPEHLRRIRFQDETGKRLVFLTNHFRLPALTVCALYRQRGQVELFFKWIKQPLRIQRFFGTSENAVKTQIWIAVSVYMLVAIIKKRLKLEASLHALLQILSVTVFEKIALAQALTPQQHIEELSMFNNQLNLFEF